MSSYATYYPPEPSFRRGNYSMLFISLIKRALSIQVNEEQTAMRISVQVRDKSESVQTVPTRYQTAPTRQQAVDQYPPSLSNRW